MTIKDFIEKLYNKSTITFYINDKIVDLDQIIYCDYELDGFECCDNAIYLYSSEYEANCKIKKLLDNKDDYTTLLLILRDYPVEDIARALGYALSKENSVKLINELNLYNTGLKQNY